MDVHREALTSGMSFQISRYQLPTYLASNYTR